MSKLQPFLMEGLKSKNGKQRAECLDDLGSIIRDYGMAVLQPSAAACLKELAKFIGERDALVRNAAINAITEAFFQVSFYIWKYIDIANSFDQYVNYGNIWCAIEATKWVSTSRINCCWFVWYKFVLGRNWFNRLKWPFGSRSLLK